MKAIWKVIRVFTFFCLPVYALGQAPSHGTAPATNRMPKDVLCTGIPDYPKGANLEFPNTATGNLQDGYETAILGGLGSVLVFTNMTLTTPNTLEGEIVKIDGIGDLPGIPMVGPDKGKGQGPVKLSAFHGATTCTVKSWYK